MGKIIKFDGGKNNKKKTNDLSSQDNLKDLDIEKSKIDLKEAIENYLLSTFAIKNILALEYIDKSNKPDVGFVGRLVYEHKRREGIFVANFIGEAVKEKNGNYKVIEIAFEAGEPHLYNQIKNILKAKNILPVIKNI